MHYVSDAQDSLVPILQAQQLAVAQLNGVLLSKSSPITEDHTKFDSDFYFSDRKSLCSILLTSGRVQSNATVSVKY